MARLRFPGCPGQRIGRNGVTYDDNKNRLQCDPSLSAVSNLQRSYNSFYELFGASDEDDEFHGFSARDVRKAIQKLRHFGGGDTSDHWHKDELASDVAPLKPADKLTGRSNRPPDPGGGGGGGGREPDRSHEVAKQGRLSAPKKGGLAPRDAGEEKRRTSGRNAAQRLLDRAKRGHSRASPKESVEGRGGLPTRNGCFQLPAMSARSSRRIIPRKRYLEDSEEDAPQLLHLQKKKSAAPLLSAVPEDASAEGATVGSRPPEAGSADKTGDPSCLLEAEPDSVGSRVSLFDQPLVVQGKRPWKPSLKVQLRLSEANLGSPFDFKGSRSGSQTSSVDSSRESIKRDMVSRYAEFMATREDTPSAEVPTSPPGAAPLEDKVAAKIARLLKSQWENRLGPGGPRRNVVLRKARLRLSQRTLKKLRQPLEESAEESVVSEAAPEVGAEEVAECPRKQRERRVPSLNGMKRERSASSSAGVSQSRCSVCQQHKRSAELAIRYGQYACRFCFRFYTAFLRKPKNFVCPKDGHCSLSQLSKCKACLVHACWNLFDIPAPLKHKMERHLRPPRGGDSRPRRPTARKRGLSEDKTRNESGSEMPKPVLSSPEDSQDTLISSSDSLKSSHGPRIKHVCRRAAVVLGQKQATFSPAGRISLSALSEEDKSRLAVHHSSQEEDSSPEVPERNRRKDDGKKRDDSGGRKKDDGGGGGGGRRRDHERRGGGAAAPGREDDHPPPPPAHERPQRRSKEHDHRRDDDQRQQQRHRQHSQDGQQQQPQEQHKEQHGEERSQQGREQGKEEEGGTNGKKGPEEGDTEEPEIKRKKEEETMDVDAGLTTTERPGEVMKEVKEERVGEEASEVPQLRSETPDGAEEKKEEQPPEAPVEEPLASSKQEGGVEPPTEAATSGRPLQRTLVRRTPAKAKGRKRARKARCNECPGCLAEDCGKCVCCRDKKKFGGKNLLKQACLERRCSNLALRAWKIRRPPLAPKADPDPLSEPSRQGPAEEEPRKAAEEEGEEGKAKRPSRLRKPKKMLPPPKSVQSYRPKLDKYKRLLRKKENATVKAKPAGRFAKKGGRSRRKPVTTCKTEEPACEEESASGKENGGGPLAVADGDTRSQESWENSSSCSTGASSSTGGGAAREARQQAKLYAPLVPKVVDHPLSSRQLSKKSVGHGNQPLVQALFWDEYERSKIIPVGFPLVSGQQFPVQAVCFLCGSAGKEELLFCSVCCEPYHWFCLDSDEVPQAGADRECWCCPRCQACSVCGHRSSQLLRCHKCQQTYHTGCLGPGYPSKPSRKKKIWLCVKCVRCKSCGTSSKNSAWNFDLSLCHDCVLLREKGNYCPLCEKCYEDDDYESMMVQCSQCQKWIHARCDGISEELYQVLSLLPETELYLCRLCEPDSPRLWLGTAERVLQGRLRCIMNSLLELQKASKDRCQVLEQAVPTPPDLMALPEEAQDKEGSLDSTQHQAPALSRTELHFVDLIKVQRRLECGEYTTVKEFCEDILQAAIASRVSAQMVRELLGKLLEEAFPGLRPSPLPPTPPHEPSALLGGGALLLAEAVLPPHGDHLYAQCQARPPTQRGLPEPPEQPDDDTSSAPAAEQGGSTVDSRRCVLCGQPGDDSDMKSGRLLYAGQDDWVHVNCALWSAEVFEQSDGSLQKVHSAIMRGRFLRCEVCGCIGATVGCCVRGCPANFHFGCARAAQAVFQDDKKVFCIFHQGNVNREVVEGEKFSVCRAVYVDQQDINSRWQKAWEESLAREISVLAGAMTIDSLGHLTEASDLENVLVPVNYRCRRLFWSTRNPKQRVVYVCRTYEVRPPRPPLCEQDYGPNVTTVHDDLPASPAPQCDIASVNCDSTAGGVSSSEPAPAELDDLDAKILDELARCVQSSDSQMDFAELLENISRSCDPSSSAKGVGSPAAAAPSVHSGDDSTEAHGGTPPSTVADQSSTACQDNSVRGAVKCEVAPSCTSQGREQQQQQDSAKRTVSVPPSTVPPAGSHAMVKTGDQPGGVNTVSVPPKCVARPARQQQQQQQQQQSVCGCTCENRTVGNKPGTSRPGPPAVTPSRARSRPAASPKTILPKVPGSQGCQKPRSAVCHQQPHHHQHHHHHQHQHHHQPPPQHHPHHAHQASVVSSALPAQSPCLGLPPVAATQPLVSYSPYAYNFPVINQYPSTINMTSVSCDKFEVYEVPGGTIIIPRQHYRLDNCVSTLSMAAAGTAQVAYLGSLPLVAAAPFMQSAAPPPLTFIGGLGGQAAPVMPLALQSPGVCGQMPLVAGSGLLANAGLVAPGVASAGLVTSVTSQTSVVNSGASTGHRTSSTSKRVPCYANAHRKMLAQKQCAKAMMMRNRILQSGGRQGAKTIVAQSRTFVAQQRCTKCVVLPTRSTAASSTVVAAAGAVKVAPTTASSSSSSPLPSARASTTTASPSAAPVTCATPRSAPSPDVYPEPDSSTEFLSGPGRVSPVLLPPPQPPFSPSPEESPRGAGDSGSLGAESIFALLQKAAQRILQDGWPADTDAECPPSSSMALLSPEGKEPVHSTVGVLPLQEEARAPIYERPYIVYELRSEDGFHHTSNDAHEVWRHLFERLQDARASANMQPLTSDDVNGFAMMGLTHKAVVYLTEQLRGADNCENYNFQYHKRNSTKLPENPSGCARLEGFRSRGGHHDMFKFLASAHRSPPRHDPGDSSTADEVEVLHKSSRRLTSLDLPMAMRFRHLKNTAREAVGVYRSNIHGRGLYCKRNIDGGEMIIEYAGEVIRAALTDKREKYYESKGIGCYMFRIDDHEVVDATMHGNAARFINHSCEPNCYSKVITVDNKKHIVIFALRSILKGEELTYDYKFPIEDVKIPCSCGSRRCRKFLN